MVLVLDLRQSPAFRVFCDLTFLTVKTGRINYVSEKSRKKRTTYVAQIIYRAAASWWSRVHYVLVSVLRFRMRVYEPQSTLSECHPSPCTDFQFESEYSPTADSIHGLTKHELRSNWEDVNKQHYLILQIVLISTKLLNQSRSTVQFLKFRILASCIFYAWELPAHPYKLKLAIVWVRSFIEPDLFNNNVPFDNTSPIYLINLLWKLGLRLA